MLNVNYLNKEFISENNTDLCVICKKDTKIPVDKHIDLRPFYIDGMGQLCDDCGKRHA